MIYFQVQIFNNIALTNRLLKEITSRKGVISEAYLAACTGDIDIKIAGLFKDRWSFYQDMIVAFNRVAKEIGKDLRTLNKKELECYIASYPLLRWIL